MLTFRMDETNFADGGRDGTRIVPDAGLKTDFNEWTADSNTLGLWHLHDGGCVGEGDGVTDASGNGHNLTNYGADPAENGYRFIRANLDYMQGALGMLPALAATTFECWLSGWAHADGETAYIGELYWSATWRTLLYAMKSATPASSWIEYAWVENGTERSARWTNAAVASLLGGKDPIHLAGVVDAANGSVRLFVNGVQRASSVATLASPNMAASVVLGWNTAKPASRSLSAVLDEVRVSSAARYTGGFTPYRLRSAGTYTGLTFDATRTQARWSDLVCAQTIPSGTGILYEVRAADETDAFGDPQAPWQSYDGDPSILPDGRYLQWRATLAASSDRLLSPTLEYVETQASEAGYNIYHASGPDPEALDYGDPDLRLGPAVTQVATDVLLPGAVHWFGIRPVDARGIESPTAQDEVRLELDEQGQKVPDRPAGILQLSAKPLPQGLVALQWRWRAGLAGALPQAFRVFGDGGTGTIDYQTPLGEVAYQATRQQYAWESGELAGDLEHQLAVRAVTAGGVWDEQPAVVRVTPDTESPADVDDLQAEAIL